jgi:hypothetical protein
MAIDDLRQNDMMAHLLDALEASTDIGRYGRLTFAMVARHFMSDDELVAWLTKDPTVDEQQARGLVQQVGSRDYNPPRPDRITEWQRQQEFPICPNGDDPDGCNVYRNLHFPDGVYENIQQYHEQKATAHEACK